MVLLSIHYDVIQVYYSSKGIFFDLFVHTRIALMNFRNPVCTKRGLIYDIGETGQNLSCLKEHKTNCEKAQLEKPEVAKQSWTNDRCIKWN